MATTVGDQSSLGKAYVFMNNSLVQSFSSARAARLLATDDQRFVVYYTELDEWQMLTMGRLDRCQEDGGRLAMWCEGDQSPIIVAINPLTGLMEVRYKISRLTVSLGMVMLVRQDQVEFAGLKERVGVMEQVCRLRQIQLDYFIDRFVK